MEALPKLFEKMTTNGYDEERAASPMDWEEEDEILRQQFDSMDDHDDDDDDSDWRPIGKQSKSTTSDRELRSNKDSWTSCPHAISGFRSWSQSYSLIPNITAPSCRCEGKEDSSVTIEISDGNLEKHANSEADTSAVEVQLNIGTTANESSSQPVSFQSENSLVKEATKPSDSSRAAPKDSNNTRSGRKAKTNRKFSHDEIEDKINDDVGKKELEEVEVMADEDCSSSQPSSCGYVTRSGRRYSAPAPAPFPLARAAPAPSPFPISGAAPPGFSPREPTTYAGPTLSEAPSKAPSYQAEFGLLSGKEPDDTKGCDKLGRNALQKSSCKKHTQSQSEKPRPDSEAMGLHDLGPVVKQMMDRELRRPVVVKEVTMPSSSNEARKEDTKTVECKTKPIQGGQAKKKEKNAPKSIVQPGKPKAQPTDFASPKVSKHNADLSAKSRKTIQPNKSEQTSEWPTPNEAEYHQVDKNSNARGGYAAAAASCHAKKSALNEVCILLDSSNAAMKTLLSPLRGALGRFWDLASSSPEDKLRIGMLTPCRKLDFVASKDEFISFCKTVQREELDCKGDLPIIEGLTIAMRCLREMSWTPGSVRYIYIFTNLSEWDHEDDALRLKLRGRISGLAHHLSRGAKTFVGCWRNDNAILEEALDRASRNFETFPLLNVKAMAAFLVRDNNLLQAVLASLTNMANMTTKQNIIRFGGNSKHLLSTRSLVGSSRYFTSEATMFQMRPLGTIHDVLSTARPRFHSCDCWMKRKSTFHVNYNEVFSLGKLGLEKGVWKEDVMLKSFKLDEINGKKGEVSSDHFKNRAYVAAVAKFFASQYNKEHRPNHCAKIKFLNGYVIERTCDKGHVHVAYAEQLLTNGEKELPRLTEFCDSSGQWDESRLDESLLRFALMCFKVSGGDLMLSGLKGIRRDNAFVLVVPSLLSKKSGDADASECTKEYMKVFRKQTKTLLDEKDWNSRKVAAEVPAGDDKLVKDSRGPDHKGLFAVLW